MLNDKSHLTAIKRSKVSAPMTWLFKSGLLPVDDSTKVLDYGCGRGFDADFFGFEKYDPYFFTNTELVTLEWDCVVCNYVLNVMSEKRAASTLSTIQNMLSKSGVAFITVRRDVKQDGFTSRGTYQRNVVLNLPIVHENSDYCIYRLDKQSKLI